MRYSLLSRLCFAGLLAGGAVPAPAAANIFDMVDLQRQMGAFIAQNPGEYGVAAMDLRDGSVVVVNGETPFPMASTVKLAIAAAYLTEVDEGRRSLNDIVRGRTAAKAMEAMIIHSDNLAADQLFATLGGPMAVQRWLLSRNLGGIRIDRTIAQLLRERGHLADVKDVATPVAMVRFLRMLDSGTALSPQSRAYLLGLMGQCRTGTRRIRALLPVGTLVEDKTGTLDGITNDVGFITLPDGRRVAIAVFARGGRDRQPVIATLSRMIYDRFTDTVRNAISVFMRLQ